MKIHQTRRKTRRTAVGEDEKEREEDTEDDTPEQRMAFRAFHHKTREEAQMRAAAAVINERKTQMGGREVIGAQQSKVEVEVKVDEDDEDDADDDERTETDCEDAGRV